MHKHDTNIIYDSTFYLFVNKKTFFQENFLGKFTIKTTRIIKIPLHRQNKNHAFNKKTHRKLSKRKL